jgi:DNA-binding CsgD family transcriptional regulator
MHAISRRARSLSRKRVGWSHTEARNRKDRSSTALAALDRFCAGVIIADNGGRVVETNHAARAILRLEDGLLVRHGQLCAARVFETARLSKLIPAAAADGNAGRTAGRMLIGRGEGRSAYVLTIAPLRPEFAAGDRPLAMILVVDPERHSPSECELAELFGLSPAEARVAVALLTGKTLAEIAATSGIRITTVRTQLASILKKVGAERQADLVRILSSAGIGSVSLAIGWLDVAPTLAQLSLSLSGM